MIRTIRMLQNRIKTRIAEIAAEHLPTVPENGNSADILYISYMGLLQPLGQSQVYRYLQRLSSEQNIVLITYERPDDIGETERFERLQDEVASLGIEWYPLRYHNDRSFAGTIWDILAGLKLCRQIITRKDIDIVHTRSYVPSILGLACKHLFETNFVFDMRGFLPDERVDAGQWETNDTIYHVAKWFETQFLRNADVVISLTQAGIDAIHEFEHIDTSETHFELIPTCVDLDLFTLQPDRREEEFVLGYVGSAGTWHMFDDVLDCFELLREQRPDSRLFILNNDEHDYIRERIKAHKIDESVVDLKAVEHSEVPKEMNRMDAGIFFYTPTFSKKGTSPTKMGEFLASGLPCLSNAAVGDVQSILEGEDVGVALESFNEDAKAAAVDRLVALGEDPATAARCRHVAESYYSLDAGVEKYNNIYQSLINE